MKFISKINSGKLSKKLGIILSLCFLCLLLEPVIKNNLLFAVNLTNYQKTIPQHNDNYPSVKPYDSLTVTNQHKSRAPEPSSLFLIVSGLTGIIVRFARRSFEKFKRASDIVLSVLGLIITSPLVILAVILIKLTSKGPVIYQQERVGKNGEIFKIFKIRTMKFDAEKTTGVVWAKKNDPRITPVGRILRKTHIDEIPQLFNVLRGEMSIVGPRPERPELVRDFKKLIRDYEKRLQVKPGITGLAQVWHKYDETINDVKKKIRYDALYIKKMCLLVDMRILARTCVVVLNGKGAR